MPKGKPVDLSDVDEVEEPTENVGAITKITYKANKNRGNGQHETVELEYVLIPNEEVEDAFKYLRETVEYLLDVDTTEG